MPDFLTKSIEKDLLGIYTETDPDPAICDADPIRIHNTANKRRFDQILIQYTACYGFLAAIPSLRIKY